MAIKFLRVPATIAHSPYGVLIDVNDEKLFRNLKIWKRF
jgi:hypothetical protein